MRTIPVERFRQNLPAMRNLLRELVLLESSSNDKTAVDQFGLRVRQELEALGGEIQLFPQPDAGDSFAVRFNRHLASNSNGLLTLCHMDTVYNLGTLARQPFREEGERILGPGVLDMKGSITMLLSVLRLFHEAGMWPSQPITALFTPDEEIGSLTSRPVIEALARQSTAAFCMEPALASGALKTFRKGTGDIEIHVRGIAAHAGIDHAHGRNAIEELAHHILAAQRLTDYDLGTTVNVGVVSGGTRGNVVPDDAYALIDFRVTQETETQRIEQWTKNLTPLIDGTHLSTSFSVNRPPRPRDATMVQACDKARAIGRALGLELSEGSTGGGSDANFVAPLGIPVLDGLGGVGDGAHSEREYVQIDSLAERSALLAALLLNW